MLTLNPSIPSFSYLTYLLKYLILLLIFSTNFLYVVVVRCSEQASDDDEGYPRDYLCNNGTSFACLCYQKDNSLSSKFVPCSHFFGQDPLPVVRIVLNGSNLENTIRTSRGQESQENYFKRRIIGASLTSYCENSTNECMNTILPIRENRVVVLKITCGAQRLSNIYYVVTQKLIQKYLSAENTMNPDKIISIINAKLKLKPVLLGHAKLVKHEKDFIDFSQYSPSDIFSKKSPQGMEDDADDSSSSDGGDKDKSDSQDDTASDYFVRNMAFFIVIIVLGIIVGIIYLIAIIKAVSDRKKQIKRMKDKAKYDESAPTPTNYGATNNGSQTSPFLKATVVSMDDAKKITSSTSDYENNITVIPQVKLSSSTASFTRIVVNHPPPPPKRRKPSIKASIFGRKQKKTLSNENLIDKNNFQFNSVKKSKTVHEIATDDAAHDNVSFLPKTNSNEIIKFDDDDDNDVENNEFKYQPNSKNQQPEIRVEMATSDDDADVDEEESTSRTEENKIVAELLTMSQTEENLLQSETSSVNEFSTESESDSDILSDQNNLRTSAANYQPLKESNWSINRFTQDETS